MTELLQKTPPWVYVLFIILLAFGLKQRKDRVASQTAMFILPIVLVAYSLYEMFFSIGINLYTISLCLIGAVAGWLFAISYLMTKGISYQPDARTFIVPGSWLPLIIIMGVFSVKYIHGAITALHPEIANVPTFLWVFSFLNGVFCGIFLARIFTYWQISKP